MQFLDWPPWLKPKSYDDIYVQSIRMPFPEWLFNFKPEYAMIMP